MVLIAPSLLDTTGASSTTTGAGRITSATRTKSWRMFCCRVYISMGVLQTTARYHIVQSIQQSN